MWRQQQLQRQQQQQQHMHRGVLAGIADLADPHYDGPRHKLRVKNNNRLTGHRIPGYVNRRSVQHLVSFLDDTDSHEVAITELELNSIRLSFPHDGGLEVLRGFFARSDTTLTKVTIVGGDFGTAQDASQLLAAFVTNRTVTDLTIRAIANLEGAALGTCISRLWQNMPQLQRLACATLRSDGVRAFRPALQANRTLRELDLKAGWMGDDGIHVLADALSGNTTMDILNIGANRITSDGLDDITRLVESTRLKKFDMYGNFSFGNEASTQRFACVLARHEFLKRLNLSNCKLGHVGIRIMVDGLVGNQIMDFLDIQYNHITSVGLTNITRLIESTQLRTISFRNLGVFDDADATQHFVTTLQYKMSTVQDFNRDPLESFLQQETCDIIKNSLLRNQQLNRVNLLLAPTPRVQQQNHNHEAAMIMYKTWHKAIAKLATVPNNAGASAIFKLLRARPALLEKRLQRPADAAAAAAAVVVSSHGRKRPQPL